MLIISTFPTERANYNILLRLLMSTYAYAYAYAYALVKTSL